IVVEFEKNIENLFVNFSTISGIVGESMKYTPHKNENIGFIRFAIGADNTKIAGLNPVPFTIERRVGSPFEHNRFFCEAPLPTDKHVKALEAIETRLSSA
ncbi:hypothetical protein, partial [Oceanibaculum nanhaiense]|uniref:hypothetical protein n=1 Tax=Oceanibaculum nanhaiense TaxID=1909734 RepID=UPI00159415E1